MAAKHWIRFLGPWKALKGAAPPRPAPPPQVETESATLKEISPAPAMEEWAGNEARVLLKTPPPHFLIMEKKERNVYKVMSTEVLGLMHCFPG